MKQCEHRRCIKLFSFFYQIKIFFINFICFFFHCSYWIVKIISEEEKKKMKQFANATTDDDEDDDDEDIFATQRVRKRNLNMYSSQKHLVGVEDDDDDNDDGVIINQGGPSKMKKK